MTRPNELGESIDRALERGSERRVGLQDELKVFGQFLDALARFARLFLVAGDKLSQSFIDQIGPDAI